MTTDNPGGGDSVKSYTPLPPGAPAWHDADWTGWEPTPINSVSPLIRSDEDAANKRAALLAAAAIWSGSSGYAMPTQVAATADWCLEWLNG
jgi:hypothetical protein